MEWKNKTETIFSIVKTIYLHRLLSIRLVQFPNESQTSTNLKLASNVWSYLSVCMCIYIYLLYLKSIELKLKRKKVYLYILLDSVYIKFPSYYYYYHYINFYLYFISKWTTIKATQFFKFRVLCEWVCLLFLVSFFWSKHTNNNNNKMREWSNTFRQNF